MFAFDGVQTVSEATTVPLSLVMSIGSVVMSLFVTMLAFLAKRNYENDHKVLVDANKVLSESLTKVNVALEEARKDRDSIRERLHADELATQKIQGEVNIVKNNHDKLADDVEEIKRTMVTRDLFDASVTNLKQQLTLILQQLQRYPSQREMRQVSPIPRSDPPR